MSVFVSFRGHDRLIKDEIVSTLRESFKNDENFKDVEVWESDEGCVSDFSSDCINAINRSSIFVVIISDKAMEPSYVINEVIAARQCEMRGTLNIIVYKITDSNYTPQFEFQLNHISYTNPNLVTNLNVLENRVKILLKKRKFGEPEKPYDVFIPMISGVSLFNQGYFVEDSRRDILNQITEKLNQNNILFLTFMDGYGKKSTIYKWLELNKKSYKNIINVFDFEGSIEDFFAHGLVFSNINENRFNNMSKFDIIKEKIKILNQVDKDTIIVVPQITLSKDTDPKVLNLVSTISCKVVFIASNLNKRIKDMFNFIEIKNMGNQYLRELFYHYYDEVTSEEEEMLNPHLDKFFDSIDGHTKSIEITAVTLANEFGVYPEDLPEIFEKIYKNSDNELSNRITALISNLFDVSNFTDIEKDILTVASLIATIPIDEKVFIEILKELNLYDGKIINSLIDKKWLEVNRNSRTIYIEKLLASACLSKIEDNYLVHQILNVLSFKLLIEISQSNRSMYKILSKTIINIFKYLEFYNASEFINLLLTFDKNISNADETDKYYNQAILELDNIDDEDIRNHIEALFDLAYNILTINNEFYAIKNHVTNDVKLLDVLNMFDVSSLEDELSESRLYYYMKDFFDAMLTYNISDIIYEYVKACNILLNESVCNDLLDDFHNGIKVLEDEDNELLFTFFINLGYNINIFTDNSMLREKIINLLYDLIKKYNFTKNKSLVFNIYSSQFSNFINKDSKNDKYFNNIETIYYEIDNLLHKHHKMFFEDIYEENSYRITLLSSMLKFYMDFSEPNKAKKIYEQLALIKDLDEDSFGDRFENFATYINFINVSGTFVDNLELMKNELTFFESLVNESKEELSESEINSLLGFLNDVKNVIISVENNKSEFTNYQDYYQAYSYKEKEKNLLNKYYDIATKTININYQSLQKDQILDLYKNLKQKVSNKIPWEIIAPNAFALVREVGYRMLGYYHHYEQIIAACAMCDGKITEVLNGEGKTYTIVLTAFLKSLYHNQVHIIDNSYYLSNRNYEWMRRIFEYFGLKVGLISESNYMKQLDDLSICNILYGTINTHMFLKMKSDISNDIYSNKLTYDCAIFDEADESMITWGMEVFSIVDDSSNDEKPIYELVYEILKDTPNDGTYFEIDFKGNVTINDKYYELVKEKLNKDLYMVDNYLLNVIKNATYCCITCLYVYNINKDYFIYNNDIKMEDLKTGYFVDFNPKYKYFLARKEKMDYIANTVKIVSKKALNMYSASEFINNYKDFCGTTATAISMSIEFKELYDKEIIHIPPKEEVIRVDYTPYLFLNKRSKFNFVINKVCEKYNKNQPVIVISGSVQDSCIISNILNKINIPHNLLNANNSNKENEILKEAGTLGKVTITTALSNRGIDILLGGDPYSLTNKELRLKGYLQEDIYKVMYDKTTDENLSIKKDFEEIFSKNKLNTFNDKHKVEQLGGLCVIGTECFDDLRNEQQVRGRAGRQGSPGESYICYSLEDQSINKILGVQIENIKMIFEMNFSENDKSNYIQDETISQSIYLMRRNMQNKKLHNYKLTNAIKYYKEHRNEYYKLINGLKNKTINLSKLLNDYVIYNSSIIEKIKKYPDFDDTNLESNLSLDKISSFINEQDITMKKYSLALYNAFIKKFNNNIDKEIVLNLVIKKIIENLIFEWKMFINICEIEISNLNNVIMHNDKRNQVLKDFVNNTYHNLIAEGIVKALCDFTFEFTKEEIIYGDLRFIEYNKQLNYIKSSHDNIKDFEGYFCKHIYDMVDIYLTRLLDNSLKEFKLFNTISNEIVNKVLGISSFESIYNEKLENMLLDDNNLNIKENNLEKLKETLLSKLIERYNKNAKDFINPEFEEFRIDFYHYANKQIINDISEQASELYNSVINNSLDYNTYLEIIDYLFKECLINYDFVVLRLFLLTKKVDNNTKPIVRKIAKKVARNDPCPCGSGKLYKNCCGKK